MTWEQGTPAQHSAWRGLDAAGGIPVLRPAPVPQMGEHPDLNGGMQAYFLFGIKGSAGTHTTMELGSAALMCCVGCARG